MATYRYLNDGGYDPYRCYHGMPIEVIRPLTLDEADEEVGPMFRVRFPDGHIGDVFADEVKED